MILPIVHAPVDLSVVCVCLMIELRLTELTRRQYKKRLIRLMRAAPFDLIKTDLNVEWIYIVLIFITDKFFVNYIRIRQFKATFYI